MDKKDDGQPFHKWGAQPDIRTLNQLQDAHNAKLREQHSTQAQIAAQVIAQAAQDYVRNNPVVTPTVPVEGKPVADVDGDAIDDSEDSFIDVDGDAIDDRAQKKKKKRK